MMRYYIDDRTLALLAAQSRLSGSFSHTCKALHSEERLRFLLDVERDEQRTHFTVRMRDDRHSLTMPNDQLLVELRLAEFIAAIANGQLSVCGKPGPSRTERYRHEYLLSDEQFQDLVLLLQRGGFTDLDIGLGQPVQIAVHRSLEPPAITAVIQLGSIRPVTSSFTAVGRHTYLYRCLIEAIEHLADQYLQPAVVH